MLRTQMTGIVATRSLRGKDEAVAVPHRKQVRRARKLSGAKRPV
jgi:hypothetical protein